MCEQTLKEVSMNQKHITILERESILEFSTLGYSNAEIGRQLERSRSAIGREIKRNRIDGKDIMLKINYWI
jgi:IS30 family transposase